MYQDWQTHQCNKFQFKIFIMTVSFAKFIFFSFATEKREILTVHIKKLILSGTHVGQYKYFQIKRLNDNVLERQWVKLMCDKAVTVI